MIEDGGPPDFLAQYKENLNNPSGDAQKFADALGTLYQGLEAQPFDTLMPWFAQGRDEPVGKFKVERFFFGLFGDYVLRLDWNTSAARKVLDAIQEVHRNLADKTGGDILFPPADAFLPPPPPGGGSLGPTTGSTLVDHLVRKLPC